MLTDNKNTNQETTQQNDSQNTNSINTDTAKIKTEAVNNNNNEIADLKAEVQKLKAELEAFQKAQKTTTKPRENVVVSDSFFAQKDQLTKQQPVSEQTKLLESLVKDGIPWNANED